MLRIKKFSNIVIVIGISLILLISCGPKHESANIKIIKKDGTKTHYNIIVLDKDQHIMITKYVNDEQVEIWDALDFTTQNGKMIMEDSDGKHHYQLSFNQDNFEILVTEM